MSDDEKRQQQLLDQCRVVHHLATQIATMYEPSQLPSVYAQPNCRIVEFAGLRTANMMETLADLLNGMDAVEPDDEWVNPIFEKAHEMFPLSSTS